MQHVGGDGAAVENGVGVMTEDILPLKATVFFDLILENQVDDLKHLITDEYFDFLQLDLTQVKSEDTDVENMIAVSYKMKIFLGVDEKFWDVGVQTAFKLKNDCLFFLRNYCLNHSDDTAVDFVFAVLNAFENTDDVSLDYLDEIFSHIPDGVVGWIFTNMDSNLLGDTNSGQYIVAQWSERLKNQLSDFGVAASSKKI